MTTLFMNWSSSGEPWQPKRRQNIVTALTTLPQGWVSARKHQCTTAITTMWTESSWAFPESYTADDSWIVRSSNGDLRKTKALRTPQPRWVSAQLLYVLVNAQRRSRWSIQNLRRPFLQAGRFWLFILLHYEAQFFPTRSVIITLHYAAQFFPYQECNKHLLAIIKRV